MSGLSKYQGVSLIELLAMLAIIIILSLASIPLFTSIFQSYRASGATENLYHSLQLARSEAVKRAANVYVSFTTGDAWCYGLNVGSACNCTMPSTCNLGTVSAEAPQQLSLSVSGFGNAFYFESTHGAASIGGTVTFTVYGQSSFVKVTVGRLGNIQMCSTGISGYQAC